VHAETVSITGAGRGAFRFFSCVPFSGSLPQSMAAAKEVDRLRKLTNPPFDVQKTGARISPV
jgi:hypothetical protein